MADNSASERVFVVNETGHVRSMDDIRTEIIREALRRYGGDRTETAKRLGISRTTLYGYVKKYKL